MRQKHFASKALGCALAAITAATLGAAPGLAAQATVETVHVEEAEIQDVRASKSEETGIADVKPQQVSLSAVTSNGTVPNFQYKLSKIGAYSGDKSSLAFEDGVVRIKKDEAYQIVANDGKSILDGELFGWSEYWGNGVYAVRINDGDINATGLVNNKGEEILPCEAAMLLTFTRDKEDARFVEVVYSNGETDKVDEAFFFTSDTSRKLITAQPSYGDTLYKGYARIFDLQQGKFVEGVQIDDANAVKEIADLGESFIIRTADSTTMYDGDGKTLWSKEGSVTAYPRCVVWSESGKRQIIDAKGDARYTTSNYFSYITSSSAWWANDYLTEDSNSLKKIIDFDGKPVLAGSYYYVNQSGNGLFLVKEKENDKAYKLLNAKGEVIAESESLSFEAVSPNYNVYNDNSNKTEGCGIVKGGKVIWKGEYSSKCNNYAIAEQNGKVFTLNDEKYSLTLDSVSGIKPGLAVGRSADSVAYGLYDVFTGKQLLTDDYDEIKYAGNNVWAYKNGAWDIYDVALEQM